MGSNGKRSKITALAQNQKLTEGVDKYFSTMKTVLVGGTTYTPTSLKALFQAEDDASNDVDSTRAQLKQQVATHRSAKAKTMGVRSDLRTFILGAYGKAALQMLGDFGMVPPRSTGNKTAQVKADAAAKARATREARGGT